MAVRWQAARVGSSLVLGRKAEGLFPRAVLVGGLLVSERLGLYIGKGNSIYIR